MNADVLLVVVALACACGCGPGQKELPTQREALHDGHGAHIVVRTVDRDAIEGELIAVHNENIYVRPGPGPAIIAIPRAQIDRVRGWSRRTLALEYAGWGALGTLSTISHGFFLLLTAPAWAAVSTGNALTERGAARIKAADPTIARYPQGLPESLRSRVVGYSSGALR